MIEFEKFFIPHIGKTGGDAIKIIAKKLNLPIINIKEDLKKGKHVPPKHLFGKKDMVLSIRKLPNREISKINQLVYIDKTITWAEVKDPALWILKECQAEKEIKKNTNDGKVKVKYFIRSEYLREDFERVLSKYFKLSQSQKNIIKNTKTKDTLTYCRDVSHWLTDEQVDLLYSLSPIWSKYEKIAYFNKLFL